MYLRKSSFNYSSGKGPTRSSNKSHTFPREVQNVAVGLIGYSTAFNGDDHEFGRMIIELDAEIDGSDNKKVNVTGRFGLRDWSGEFDDKYSGNIQYIIAADLVPAPVPGPGDARSDLIVVDAEFTQAIQHFRSADHLAPPNVFPDNSIRLVRDKPGFVRLYTDYDVSSGLPAISSLSGEIEITNGSTTQTIASMNQINPVRDINIDRAQLNHTLNFQIPESMCRGTLTVRAKIFSTSDPSQFSATLEKSFMFETFPALPITAVAVKYTGDDVKDGATDAELEAPLMSDFNNVFQFTEKVYPIPNVVINSFMNMTYDKDIESDISSGGCDKFSDLLDSLEDFIGDSDDIVYGMINSGVETGSVGGCGRSGVVAGKINAQGTAAHEIGHGLGRKHAPCDNVTRCAEPANTDGNFPVYSGYDSDSIGEFGIDPLNGNLLNPGSAHDFMGYSGTRWVSPYTYKALMSKIPSEFDGASPSPAGASRMMLSGGSLEQVSQ